MRASCRRTIAAAGACTLACLAGHQEAARAFEVQIAARNPRILYLQVGVGSFSGGNYNAGGTPANNATVNVVSVTVPTAQVGTGVAQAMTTNSTAARGFYDGFAACNLPGQLYLGAFYRSVTVTGEATLIATSPQYLVNAAGDRIPFSEISWTSADNRNRGGPNTFPAGNFSGGAQAIGSVKRNRWGENCHTFTYRNTLVVPGGTYTGRVTYTLSTP